MELRPGALLGLPPGVPSAIFDIGYFRDLLVLVALAAGLAMARRREAAAVALAIAWAVLAVGFWTAALARPYGVLQDPGATRWAADVSVAAHAGGDGGFLAGEVSGHPASQRLARRVGARAVLLAPSFIPILVMPAIAVLIALTRRARAGALAAILWMAASTLDVDVVRGTALLPALWPTAMGAHPGLALSDLPGTLVFDALPWLVLAACAQGRARDPGAVALAAAGALGLVLAAAGVGSAILAAAVYRAGLVLAAAPLIARVSERIAPVRVPLPRGRAWTADGAALRGAIVAVALAGAFPTWWDAPRLDPVLRDSLEPIPAGLADSMAWLRAHTDPAATFVAGEDYAAAVAVLGGRRVLRAPDLDTAGDDERRVRAERAVLSGRRADALVSRYGVRYALLAPGQFRGQGLPEPWPVESSGATLVHRNPSGLRVYELPPPVR
jgi:hypothetical protein